MDEESSAGVLGWLDGGSSLSISMTSFPGAGGLFKRRFFGLRAKTLLSSVVCLPNEGFALVSKQLAMEIPRHERTTHELTFLDRGSAESSLGT